MKNPDYTKCAFCNRKIEWTKSYTCKDCRLIIDKIKYQVKRFTDPRKVIYAKDYVGMFGSNTRHCVKAIAELIDEEELEDVCITKRILRKRNE